jgi:hypothetical protein
MAKKNIASSIPTGAMPTKRSGFRRFLRNTFAVPLAKLVGIDVKPISGLDDRLPNANPYQAVENLPDNVKDALNKMLDFTIDKYLSCKIRCRK